MKPCLTHHELKQYLAEVVDFGDLQLVPEDDYPDSFEPLARTVTSGQVERGVTICGSGVGACVVANKVDGVRACLVPIKVDNAKETKRVNETFLAS